MVETMTVEIVGFEMIQGPVENAAEGAKPEEGEWKTGKSYRSCGGHQIWVTWMNGQKLIVNF